MTRWPEESGKQLRLEHEKSERLKQKEKEKKEEERRK